MTIYIFINIKNKKRIEIANEIIEKTMLIVAPAFLNPASVNKVVTYDVEVSTVLIICTHFHIFS